MPAMRSLVTGGAGFIGSHLVDALLARRDEVIVVDDLSTGRHENLDSALAKGAELVTADIRDGAAMSALARERRPERIFHLAAQIDVRRSVADPGFDSGINVNGTINMLEAARAAGSGRFVFISTGGAIYGEGEGKELPLGEDAPVEPLAPYGLSKFCGEGYVELYRRLHRLAGVSLRLGNVYGPRQDPLGEAGVIAIFCGRLRDGGRPTVFGDGRQSRDYIYVGDEVEGVLAAADSDTSGAYNLGTGRETTVLELVELLSRLGASNGFEPEFAPARPGEVQRIVLDSARAAADLGWRAATQLEPGLELTLSAA
jgi:UDP-glucose 4-epimerase